MICNQESNFKNYFRESQCLDSHQRYSETKPDETFCFPRFHKLKQIAIGEISIGKGHRYLTIVLDLKSGAVVYVGESKGAEALKRFWKILKRQKVHIEAVATDLSPAYISAVQSHLPKAVLELNQPLALAYYMKEDLRQIWMQSDRTTATKILHDWVQRAFASGISTLIKFAKTVAMYRSGIRAYYDYPISTGRLEGTNNKIKTMKRQAYGLRDLEFFKLKILALHNAKYALVG